ncbi:tetratricopeptide repeat protein [Alkalinema pantanalense CENA528]|uniref:tetratricopeptide repeat protein n=1 Tax=Alkalinema pantanalense TaxID=1620705 RepID=UPI003D6E7C1D
MSLFRVLLSLVFLAPIVAPLRSTQAQTLTCQNVIAIDRANWQWYPAQPLAQSTVIDRIAQLQDELNAIANAPANFDEGISTRLFQLLVSNPTARPPESPTIAEVEQILPELSALQRSQLIATSDRLVPKIAVLTNEPNRDVLFANLAKYYQRLGQGNRAGALLDQALQAELKVAANQRRFTVLLKAATDLGQSTTIAPRLPQLEATITATHPELILRLAQAYQSAGNQTKALALFDRFAKTQKPETLQPELVIGYVKLNRLEKAKPYLDAILKGYIHFDDHRYGDVIATYEKAKQPQIADQLFNKSWKSIQNELLDQETPFLQNYFKAGGSPDRILNALQKDQPDRKFDHLLTVAGEYRKRNQPKIASQAIEQWIQVAIQLKNRDTTYLLWQMAEKGYLPEVKVAMARLIPLNRIDAKGFRLVPLAQKLDLLDAIEPLIQRLLKSDPEARIDLLQQLAIAYAETAKPDKAVAIAERIPRKYPAYSPAIATLAQVAATLHRQGQTTPAQTILTKTTAIAAGIKELDTRAQAYAAISIAQVQMAQQDAAEASRKLAVQWAKAAPNPQVVLGAIVQQFLDQRQLLPAWKTFQAIPTVALKETNIDNLIITALAVGDLAIAQSAIDLVAQYHPPRSFLFTAPRLVRAYLGRGQVQEAVMTLDRSAKVWTQLPESERSSDDLEAIVQLYSQTEQIAAAQTLIDQYPNAQQPGYAQRKQQLQAHLDCYRSRR